MKRSHSIEIIKHANGDDWARMSPEQRAAVAREHGVLKNDDGGQPDALVIGIEAFKTLAGEVGKLRKAQVAHEAEFADLLKQVGASLNPDRPLFGGNARSIGEVFVKSESFKSVFGNLTGINANARAVAPIEGGVLKAILSNATGVPDRTRLPNIVPVAPDWTRWAFARLAQGQMTGGVLEYVQDTSAPYNQAIAPTAEGSLKPEVTNTFALKTVVPKTLAHWLTASKQILADASALRGFLDSRLLYGLVRKLEYQVVRGDGTGQNFVGLLNVAPNAGAAVAGDNAFDTLAKACAVVDASGWLSDTVCLNPIDVTALSLAKGDDGHYIMSSAYNPLAGKVIVPSPEITIGEYLVGDFARGAQLFEREAANVVAGFQNDDFVKNLVTLLAEMRAGLAIYGAAAFRKGALPV